MGIFTICTPHQTLRALRW